MRAAAGFAVLTARNLFSGKRAWAALLLAALPPAVAATVAGLGGEKADGTLLFQGIAFFYSLRIMLYLMALIFGIALTSGEIEDGTVGYIYLGALPKWAIALIQSLVAAAALTALAGLSLLLTALAAGMAARHPLEAAGATAAKATLVAGVGILVSLTFYTACGLAFKRPLIVGIVATFFWEIVLTQLPIRMAAYTVTNNLRALMLPLLFDGDRGRWYRYVRNYDFPAYGEAALFLSVLTGLFLVAAMVAAMNRSVEGKEAN